MKVDRAAVRVRAATRADCAGVAAVQVRAWQETYAGLLPDEYLRNLSQVERQRFWERAVTVPRAIRMYVAGDPERPVGFAAGGARQSTEHASFTAEVYAIYVLPAYQRRGVGSRMLGYLCEWMLKRGHQNVMLWALATNPSRGYYLALRARRLPGVRREAIGGRTVTEIAYGWSDLAALTDNLSR